jgi:hypothetical protein
MRRRVVQGMLGAVVLATAACSSGSDTVTDPPAVTPPETGSGYSISYAPTTVRIPDAVVPQALVSVDSASKVYRFNADALSAASVTLQPGRILLVPGVALRRIAAVNTAAGVSTVTTSYVSLNEAFREAEITWDAPLRYTPAVLAGARIRAGDEWLAPSVVQPNGSVQWQYTAGANEITASLSAAGSNATIELTVLKKTGGAANARFTARTVIGEMRSLARIDIENNKTERFDYDAKGLGGTVDLDITAAGAGLDELAFDWPEAMIRFPVQVGPLPVIVALKVQVVTKLVVNGNASATARTSFSYGGDAGFRYNGTTMTTTASAGLGTPVLGASTGDAAAFIGNEVDAQFGFAAPKIEVGIFGETIVPFIRPEFFVGSRLQWGPVCKSAYVKYLVQGGIDLRFFGSTIASRTDTISGPFEVRESQDNCAGGNLRAGGHDEIGFGGW